MKFRLLTIILVIILSAVAVSVVAAHDNTHTQAQLVNAGWLCGDEDPETPPPGHCFTPGFLKRASARTISVKVFDETGHFKGTEILWNKNIYAGQPCPQDVLLDLEEIAGIPYWGCHRYPDSA